MRSFKLQRKGKTSGEEGPAAASPASSKGDDRAVREAAEREALARLGQAERRRTPEPPAESAGYPAAPATAPTPGEEPPEERVVAPSTPEAPPPAPERRPGSPGPPGALIAGLKDAVRELDQLRSEEQALARELEQAEKRLAENRDRAVEALKRAANTLDELEARALAAEERAPRAE